MTSNQIMKLIARGCGRSQGEQYQEVFIHEKRFTSRNLELQEDVLNGKAMRDLALDC